MRFSFLPVMADKSRETKRSISMGSMVAILGRGMSRVRARARVFMELKIEKLFGEEFAGKLAPSRERKEKSPFYSPRPITDYSVVFAALPGVLRRRESAISFPEIRRDFFMRISCFFRSVDIYFSFSFRGNIYYFSLNMVIISRIEWNNNQR